MRLTFPAIATVSRGALVLDGINLTDLAAMLRAHGERVRVTIEFVSDPPLAPVRQRCAFCKRDHYPQDSCPA